MTTDSDTCSENIFTLSKLIKLFGNYKPEFTGWKQNTVCDFVHSPNACTHNKFHSIFLFCSKKMCFNTLLTEGPYTMYATSLLVLGLAIDFFSH